MAPSAVNEARRELAQLRSMIDDARRDLGIEAKPAQIAARRFGRRRLGSRKATRATRKSSAA
jgi:hypothetical protein